MARLSVYMIITYRPQCTVTECKVCVYETKSSCSACGRPLGVSEAGPFW